VLHSKAVYPDTLDVLKKIMQFEVLNQFNLVGGTALALQIGHRISIDLDLFTHDEYDSLEIFSALELIGEVEIMVDNRLCLLSRSCR